MEKLFFPKDFYWGASTAAHQVEGGNFNNDWWEFEQKGKIKDGSSSKIACDHYHLYKNDFALAKKLGHNAHRLSLEWSRIQPSPKNFSRRETEHYRQVLLSLKKYRLTTFVTLHHFTNPSWFSKIGSWENTDAPVIFQHYIEYCVEKFGDLIDFWLTINEPQGVVMEGYLRGRFPPEKANPFLAIKAAKNLTQAHRLAYQAIHRKLPSAKVSFVSLHNYFEPRFLISYSDWFLNQAKGFLDYIGLDYYHYFKLGFGGLRELGQEKGLLPLLVHLGKNQLPIYITENGTAGDDNQRQRLIIENLKSIHQAIKKGVDVRGYLHWTLMDNFEWFQGISCRMGLCETDYQALKRTPRPSAILFKKICQNNFIIV